MITHTSLVAGNLPIKTLVARQLPTNTDVTDNTNGNTFQLTSLGDVFYQCWHYQLQDQGGSPQSLHHELSSPQLMVGYDIWLSEACQQEQVKLWPTLR